MTFVSSSWWELVVATVVVEVTGCVEVVSLDAERAKRQIPRTTKMMLKIPTNPPTDPPIEVPVSRENTR